MKWIGFVSAKTVIYINIRSGKPMTPSQTVVIFDTGHPRHHFRVSASTIQAPLCHQKSIVLIRYSMAKSTGYIWPWLQVSSHCVFFHRTCFFFPHFLVDLHICFSYGLVYRRCPELKVRPNKVPSLRKTKARFSTWVGGQNWGVPLKPIVVNHYIYIYIYIHI